MLLTEREIDIPSVNGRSGLLSHLTDKISSELAPDELPVRMVVTHMNDDSYACELGVLSGDSNGFARANNSIFSFRKRSFENADQFNAVLLIPTGIGAELGGHSGDGGPVARLLSAACDTLITHPNVVNAADINELPEKDLYVEGSVITRLLMGSIGLQRARANRLILLVDEHSDEFFTQASINDVSAARAAIGIDCRLVVRMDTGVLMRALYSKSGRAVGRIEHFEEVCRILKKHRNQYDAVALSSLITIPRHFHAAYFQKEDMVNPWGGVEAMLTHAISMLFDVPSAHSPMMTDEAIMNLDVGVVDPRKAAEAVSTTYLHCILSGLHKSPRIVSDPPAYGAPGMLTASDVSCLVIPCGCVGLPTLAALEQGIPVIAVKENRNHMRNELEALPFGNTGLFIVENYLEAVGVMNALRAGVAIDTVRRPLAYTKVKKATKKRKQVKSKAVQA